VRAATCTAGFFTTLPNNAITQPGVTINLALDLLVDKKSCDATVKVGRRGSNSVCHPGNFQ
jgi:hypothetical protein